MATYHHGDLPVALRAATVELIGERGPSGFSLREVARRAGVSHAAPAHHFGDAEGLLTSVATEGFARLADAMEAAAVGHEHDAAESLRHLGRAYVRVALQNPGHFAVILQRDLIRSDDPKLLLEGARAYAALQNVVRIIRDQLNPELDIDTASTFCWASIQGLVDLTPSLSDVAANTCTDYTSLDGLVDRFNEYMIAGLSAR